MCFCEKRFVGNGDISNEDRVLLKDYMVRTLIINFIGYIKGYICCNLKFRM